MHTVMDCPRACRRAPSADEPISRVRLRTGRVMTVVNISDCGVLVEGEARLLPGTHVDVHVITRDGRLLVRSRVARCCVHAVAADAVRYRGALAFDRRVETGYAVPDAVAMSGGPSGADYPVEHQPADHTDGKPRAA